CTMEPRELARPVAELNGVVLIRRIAVRTSSGLLVSNVCHARAEDAGQRPGDRAAIRMQRDRKGAVHVKTPFLTGGLESRSEGICPVGLSQIDQLNDAARVRQSGRTVTDKVRVQDTQVECPNEFERAVCSCIGRHGEHSYLNQTDDKQVESSHSPSQNK